MLWMIRLRVLGRWAISLGLLTTVAGAVGLWFLYAAKEFSSQVRDPFEAAPSFGSYLLLAGAVLVLVVMCGIGLMMTAAGVSAEQQKLNPRAGRGREGR